jgi:hypothetical protein
MPFAIFTVCIGEEYIRRYEAIFHSSVRRYAANYDYDLYIIPNYLHPEKYRSPSYISFMKHFVPITDLAERYEKIMVIDADILINENSPPFHLLDTEDKIGVIDEYRQPTPEEREEIQRKNDWPVGATAYYDLFNLKIDTVNLINSGVFICNPKLHYHFFANLITKHIDLALNHKYGFHYEQAVFGYELQKQNLYKFIDEKWNKIWGLYKQDEQGSNFMQVYDDSYLLHMTGGMDHHLALSISK